MDVSWFFDMPHNTNLPNNPISSLRVKYLEKYTLSINAVRNYSTNDLFYNVGIYEYSTRITCKNHCNKETALKWIEEQALRFI